MIKDDFSVCPKCDFPAIYSEFLKYFNFQKTIMNCNSYIITNFNFIRYLETEISCPMCSVNISRNDVKKLVDIDKYLKISGEEEK